MKSLKNWSILRLVVVLAVASVAMLAIVGITGYSAMKSVNSTVKKSIEASTALRQHTAVNSASDMTRADTLATTIRSDALNGAVKDMKSDVALLQQVLPRNRAALESGTYGAQARAVYERLVAAEKPYTSAALQLGQVAQADPEAAVLLVPKFQSAYHKFDNAVNDLIPILQKANATDSSRATTDASSAQSRTLLFLVVGLAVVGAISLVVGQRVRRMLKDKAAAETGMARIQAMVENMPINVMYADRDFVIQYMNPIALRTFRTLEAHLPTTADKIVGSSMDVFHRSPAHQRGILGDPANLPHHAEFQIGPETVSLEASAIYDQHGEFMGTMATWELITEQRAMEQKEREQAENLRLILDEVTANASALSSSSAELSAISETMSSGAEHAASEASVVSAASEQVSTSAGTVAAGIEEMQASISEIARGAQDAANTATQAVAVARETEETIAKLGQSSVEIGAVVDVISSIAEDTNVLALNATIEAARAGEAGKGFAVVANEVKDLANETAKATDDIKHKIERIQADADASVAAIARIAEVVHAINSTQETIAASVEEQTATTSEIARNVAEVAQSSGEIAASIQGVATAAQETSTGASETRTAADELSRLASQLQSVVDSGQRVG